MLQRPQSTHAPGAIGTGVSAELLMDALVFPVCAPSLTTDGRRPLAKLEDLQHHTLLHDESAAGRPGVPDWPAWLQSSGATHVNATRGPVFASIYLAQEAAVAGHGVALGVAPLVEEDLHHGRLIKPFDHSLANAYALWTPTRPSMPSVDGCGRKLQVTTIGRPRVMMSVCSN